MYSVRLRSGTRHGETPRIGGNPKNQPISELDIFSKRQALSRAVVVNSNMSRGKYLAREGPGSRLVNARRPFPSSRRQWQHVTWEVSSAGRAWFEARFRITRPVQITSRQASRLGIQATLSPPLLIKNLVYLIRLLDWHQFLDQPYMISLGDSFFTIGGVKDLARVASATNLMSLIMGWLGATTTDPPVHRFLTPLFAKIHE